MRPISRLELIRKLKQLGFEGPYAGGKHMFLIRGSRRLTLPNPHQTDIGVGLLKRILQQAGITESDWQQVD
jgi:predicted RNA binding protein YcfA (HicA-like mRNA interferase family)